LQEFVEEVLSGIGLEKTSCSKLLRTINTAGKMVPENIRSKELQDLMAIKPTGQNCERDLMRWMHAQTFGKAGRMNYYPAMLSCNVSWLW
jgi:hypothetical protein